MSVHFQSRRRGETERERGVGGGGGERRKGAHSRDNGRRRGGWNGDGRKMKGEDSEWGREYWLTCNTESGGGRDPANIKYIITFILISLLAPVCLLARLHPAMAPSAERARTTNLFIAAAFPPPRQPEFSPFRKRRAFLSLPEQWGIVPCCVRHLSSYVTLLWNYVYYPPSTAEYSTNDDSVSRNDAASNTEGRRMPVSSGTTLASRGIGSSRE